MATFITTAWIWLVLAQAAPANAPLPAKDAQPSQIREAFRAMLDRPKVPLDARSEANPQEGKGEFHTERLSFATEKKADGSVERVPVLIVKPTKDPQARRPAVILLHGTGGNKDAMRPWLDDLARRGFVALAIDARYHGDRSGGAKGSAAYVDAISRAWRTKPGEPMEHPFYYDTVWDLWRTVDYLETRPDVDPKRIGMVGISMGGIETWLAASADERVATMIPAIGVQSFQWSLANDAWQGRANTIRAAHELAARDLGEERVNARVCRALWDKVIPGILGPFDCPNMLRLCAGRPMLILNTEKDVNCPITGAKIAFEAAEAAYKEAGASAKLKILVASSVGHTVIPAHREAALEWLVTWLRP